jgi:SAM-dependent methyltransferase
VFPWVPARSWLLLVPSVSFTMRMVAAHNWLALRRNRQTVERCAPLCHGDLLDIGCGEKPHEELLRPFLASYTGLDHPDTLHSHKAELWGSATALPCDDKSYDTVVMFQTLEHVEEPGLALSEAYRVMRPGGLLFVTTPFMWGIHEQPRDFYRYTPYAMTYLCEKAGFTNVTVTSVGGYWLTAGLRFSYYLQMYAHSWRRPLVRPFQHAAQLLGDKLDHLDGAPQDSAGYTTLAYKR